MKITLVLPKNTPPKVLPTTDKLDALKQMQIDSDLAHPSLGSHEVHEVQSSDEEDSEDKEEEEEEEEEVVEHNGDEKEREGSEGDNIDVDDCDNDTNNREGDKCNTSKPKHGPHKKGMLLYPLVHLAHNCLQGRPHHLLSSQRQL
jgi:hypothetical protein